MHPLLALAAVVGALWLAASGSSVASPSPTPARLRVAHLGDSLTAYTLADLSRAYAEVGLDVEIDAYGGRAVLQKLASDPRTGREAARALTARGPFDLYVVALGTNDTANVAVGASYTRDQAIDALMGALPAGARVIWVQTVSKVSSGPYQSANMKAWNVALERAKARWPSLSVMAWNADGAAFSDGLHHTNAGYTVRNRAIAKSARAELP